MNKNNNFNYTFIDQLTNNKKWLELKEEIFKLYNSFDFSKSEYILNTKEINKKIKKFRSGELIKLKEYFPEYKWNNINYYDKIIGKLNNLVNENYKNLIKLKNDLENFLVSLIIKNKLEDFFNYHYDWISDSITDLSILLELKYKFNKNFLSINSFNLFNKIIFKEAFSMIDRLQTEASISAGDKLKIFNSNNIFESNIRKQKYNKFMPQDYIFNLSRKICGHEKFITKFDLDKEGWVTFSFENWEKILKLNENYLWYLLNNERNNYEHSFPTNFVYQDFKIYDNYFILKNNFDKNYIYNKIFNFWENNL